MSEKFNLQSPFRPTGDQPEAIDELCQGLSHGQKAQVLLGVTGSGKTFTMANVIERHGRPTLILSHNKTLAAQLYEEMRQFFPQNAVEYYVSYYDYYQPEAYLPQTDVYIEKDLNINEEIDRLRLSAVSALLSGRSDVVVVSSVSCIYGMGGPAALHSGIISLRVGEKMSRQALQRKLVDILYVRNDITPARGSFRVKGDTVDIFMAYSDKVLRVVFWDEEVESIEEVDAVSMRRLSSFRDYQVYPANIFLTTKEQQQIAIRQIQDDLRERIAQFEAMGEPLRARRIKERVEYDMEMIKELGYCSGIENYSRYFDGRKPGERPYCLLDFFPKDFLLIIDESHVSVPQLRAMYGGDRARKTNLVEYGFRLPAAFDNRPLSFDEFQGMSPQTIYVSATPADFELAEAGGVVVDQLIRPTGLLDPVIEVRPTLNQIDDLMEEIRLRAEKDERILVTTLTKRMAEELTDYLLRGDVRATYIHSDVSTLDRVQILSDLRRGLFDVLVGVNLLREGLDLPEVSLVAILDADKEGFLRDHRSLTQTAGRAARNINGKVIMYADSITGSMQFTIDETNRRREKQLRYNEQHGITPTQIQKNISAPAIGTPDDERTSTKTRTKTPALPGTTAVAKGNLHAAGLSRYADYPGTVAAMAADPITLKMSAEQLQKSIDELTRRMQEASKQLDFIVAAQYRDEIMLLQDILNGKK